MYVCNPQAVTTHNQASDSIMWYYDMTFNGPLKGQHLHAVISRGENRNKTT